MNDYNIDDLLALMKRLRRECPWDAKQTHHSLKSYLLEESYEIIDCIDENDPKKLAEELGDLLLQIVFHATIGEEKDEFTFADVVSILCRKLIERHPHVFSDKEAQSAEEVQRNWEQSKIIRENRDSLLDHIPKSMPALLQAEQIQKKAASVGFDWKSAEPVMEKVSEECREFEQACQEKNRAKMQEEFGDLLFALVNLSRFLEINAEEALKKANNKFIRRFQYIEKQYNGDINRIKQAGLNELDDHWNQAKKRWDL